MRALSDAKLFLEHSLSITPDALHVVLGVLFMFVLALIVRKPLSQLFPWAGVLLLALINEAGDLWMEQWSSAAMQLGEGAKDIVLTMLLPTLIFLTTRVVPSLYCPPASAPGTGRVGETSDQL